MLFSVEQAFVGRDEKRAPLKTPAWEAKYFSEPLIDLFSLYVSVTVSFKFCLNHVIRYAY